MKPLIKFCKWLFKRGTNELSSFIAFVISFFVVIVMAPFIKNPVLYLIPFLLLVIIVLRLLEVGLRKILGNRNIVVNNRYFTLVMIIAIIINLFFINK